LLAVKVNKIDRANRRSALRGTSDGDVQDRGRPLLFHPGAFVFVDQNLQTQACGRYL